MGKWGDVRSQSEETLESAGQQTECRELEDAITYENQVFKGLGERPGIQ